MNISKKNNKGMTLMEILIVVMLIGILAGVLIKSLAGTFETGKQSAAKAFLEKTLPEKLLDYNMRYKQWPTDIKALIAAKLIPDDLKDPWGGNISEADKTRYGLTNGSDDHILLWVNFKEASTAPSDKKTGLKYKLDINGALTSEL